jgi:hypothetical protein
MNKQVNYELNKRNFIAENNKIVLTIPDNFIGKKIEVFATEGERKKGKIKRGKEKNF